MKTSSQIRQEFLDFFKSKQHEIVASASVIPYEDPTLLFTNAGMNQFKNIFLGLSEPKYKRAADTQKCIRAGGKHNDLEEVGVDGYHHTFFEMLGNWSFGDYYKEEAISWAWELFTEIWQLPKDKLHATVYQTDEEAYELWKKVTDINPSHITKHGNKDNFWEMGESGPCGPCSEIHFDRGVDFCDKQNTPGHVCAVNGDCQRYIELWNLVFIQYNRQETGELEPLPNRYVDTGAGFERLCQIMQGKTSNYDTDVFTPLLSEIEKISGVKYETDARGVSHRVIADHLRTLNFAIADGGLPSNEGRGYVLRRILRRAARHGRLLELKQPFLYKLTDILSETMGAHFPELKEKSGYIKMVIKAEEERFNLTLDKGLEKFTEIVEKTKGEIISGKDAFLLYDTYGFPLDLTQILSAERGLTVETASFSEAMAEQKERARRAGHFKLNLDTTEWLTLNEGETVFCGYETLQGQAKILKYALDDDNNIKFTLDRTPFYAEQGGQAGDKGLLTNADGKIEITDTKLENGLRIHFGKLIDGTVTAAIFNAVVNEEERLAAARNHTATHLLHAALRDILGEHVQQKGSYVSSGFLRFDLTHFKQIEQSELKRVEEAVNEKIRACLPVTTEITDVESAKKAGATALFGEKYGERVRLVTVGDYSKELCGGTHVKNSGQIGILKITSETSVAAGVRRIEAITGKAVQDYLNEQDLFRERTAKSLGVPMAAIEEKLEKILEEQKVLQRDYRTLQQKLASGEIKHIIEKAKEKNGVILAQGRTFLSADTDFKALADEFASQLKSGIGVMINTDGEKINILSVVTKDLVKKYHAGKIAGELAAVLGGKGGGRPDMATAGGKNLEKVDEALANISAIIFNS